MSVSHGHITIGGIEYGGCGEDKKEAKVPKIKKERPKSQIKNERKREKGQCYYPFSHLYFKVAP